MYNAKSNKRNIHNILIVELLHNIFIGLLYHFISNILVVKIKMRPVSLRAQPLKFQLS